MRPCSLFSGREQGRVINNTKTYFFSLQICLSLQKDEEDETFEYMDDLSFTVFAGDLYKQTTGCKDDICNHRTSTVFCGTDCRG